jgi:hypothetical protein
MNIRDFNRELNNGYRYEGVGVVVPCPYCPPIENRLPIRMRVHPDAIKDGEWVKSEPPGCDICVPAVR